MSKTSTESTHTLVKFEYPLYTCYSQQCFKVQTRSHYAERNEWYFFQPLFNISKETVH